MRLIDADASADKIMRDVETHADEIGIGGTAIMIAFARAMRDETDFPTIEAEPVRHALWIRNAMSDGYHCSDCGHHVDGPIGEMIDPRDYECYLDKYCGGCGARMDAEDIDVLTEDGGANDGS